MKFSHWIGGALLASAIAGYGSAALAEDAAPPPADAAPAAAADDAAAAPAPAKPAKKKVKMGAADGIWAGSFMQVGHSGGYKMAIKFAGKTIETDYPDQSCGGKLTKVGTKGDTSFYVETITRGGVDAATGKGCIDGNVTLIKAGDGYIWGWVGQHDGKPIVAYGTLAKQAAPEQ
ncbi:hypothetical protein C3941_22410 [Kaistia algarum]|uniref:hypothetical protein n=1 Tax=Kaistia algarum TaxID=2083279 RepID=UPI000CE74C75|nr:hypothetical protein [Kaistia algarum]MCX5515279.1 hypothetical protein [Kaistia algarum]PPE77705.1 hypothetical protein C3941_22410 [Kaistia algarum]